MGGQAKKIPETLHERDGAPALLLRYFFFLVGPALTLSHYHPAPNSIGDVWYELLWHGWLNLSCFVAFMMMQAGRWRPSAREAVTALFFLALSTYGVTRFASSGPVDFSILLPVAHGLLLISLHAFLSGSTRDRKAIVGILAALGLFAAMGALFYCNKPECVQARQKIDPFMNLLGVTLSIGSIALAILAIGSLLQFVRFIRKDERAIVFNPAKGHEVLGPGLRFIGLPFFKVALDKALPNWRRLTEAEISEALLKEVRKKDEK